MEIKHLHSWESTPKEAVALQRLLSGNRVSVEGPHLNEIKTVAGADISMEIHGDTLYAAVVVMSFPGLEVIETAGVTGPASFPYVPGLLSFRETPLLLKAFERIENVPDAVIIDGHGIAHPRGFGIATHVGLFLDVPTIGCAKSVLYGSYDIPDIKRGSFSGLLDKEGNRIGAAVRTRRGISPVFVSVGNKADLDSCIRLVLACATRYRLPEPSRQAHILANKLRLIP
jgi:deoxyribonuclease V